MSKILVTGGAGFIGSHLVDKLLKQNNEVHVVDNLSSGNRSNVSPLAKLHVIDIRDKKKIDRLFSRNRFETIFHDAAQMSVIRSVRRPSFDAYNNIVGTINLLEASQKNGAKKFIFASSGGVVYGNPKFIPQTEEHSLKPISPYGIAKVVCEMYLEYFWETYGLPYVALRYANVYGPRQSPKSGAGVIGTFLEKILNHEQPIINGSGNKTRDYIYVSDVIAANIKAAKYQGVGAFNVGTGIETNVNSIFRIITSVLAPDTPEIHNGEESGEQLRSVLDITKARKILGWSPKVSFESGIKRTIKWYVKQHKTK